MTFLLSIALLRMRLPDRPPVRVRKLQDDCPKNSPACLRERLQVGDILLVSNGLLNWIRPVIVFQNQFEEFSPASRKFTHAGIYVGNETVVHSMPDLSMDYMRAGGVSRIPLAEFLSDGVTFTVLRFPDLTDEHHEALHDAVTLHVGKPYGYIAIMRCLGFVKPFRSLPKKSVRNRGLARALVCTDFIYMVYDEVFQQRNPFNQPSGYVTPVRLPCEFYANPSFVDVDLDCTAIAAP